MTDRSESCTTIVTATSQGVTVELRFRDKAPVAEKPETALENIRRQLCKHTGPFAFSVGTVEATPVRFYPAATLNGIRRDLAAALQAKLEARPRPEIPHAPRPGAAALNRSSLDIPGELLRSRFCIRWELGLCPKRDPRSEPGVTEVVEPLYLVNQGNRLRLKFDCARCEMVISVN